jgi:hypothetical protein
MDYYLKADTEADMNAALIAAGLAYDEDGALFPAFGVCLDVIGPITRTTGFDANGDPITETFPEWHVNVRCAGLTPEAEAEIEAFKIIPPNQPFRVWA